MPKSIPKNTAIRENTASLIRNMMGQDVFHGFGLFAGSTRSMEQGPFTTGVLKIIGEEPVTDGTIDLIECDIFIVPRSRKANFCEDGSFDRLDVEMCKAIEE